MRVRLPPEPPTEIITMKWTIYQHYKNGKPLKAAIKLENCGFDHVENKVSISNDKDILMTFHSPNVRLNWKGIAISGPEETVADEHGRMKYNYQELWCVASTLNDNE